MLGISMESAAMLYDVWSGHSLCSDEEDFKLYAIT